MSLQYPCQAEPHAVISRLHSVAAVLGPFPGGLGSGKWSFFDRGGVAGHSGPVLVAEVPRCFALFGREDNQRTVSNKAGCIRKAKGAAPQPVRLARYSKRQHFVAGDSVAVARAMHGTKRGQKFSSMMTLVS